jgi:hypothetical protein
MSLRSTCAGVQEGLAAALYGPWWCRGAKEALGVAQLLCFDTLRVRWCWLGVPLGVFLVAKEVGFRANA